MIGEHQLNRESSRSHCVFTLALALVREGDEGRAVRASIHLVDLAGSERVSKTRSEGLLLREAGHINKSLHILEQARTWLLAVVGPLEGFFCMRPYPSASAVAPPGVEAKGRNAPRHQAHALQPPGGAGCRRAWPRPRPLPLQQADPRAAGLDRRQLPHGAGGQRVGGRGAAGGDALNLQVGCITQA